MKTSILTSVKSIKRNENQTFDFENKVSKGFVNIDTFCDNNEVYVQIRKTDKFTNNVSLVEKFFKTKKAAINFVSKKLA